MRISDWSSDVCSSDLARGADHLERERHVAAFVAEHPVGARCQPVQQSTRAQVVDVGERAEEEQTLDAAGEADQVEQEPAALLARLDAPEVLHAVDPLEAELGLAPDRRAVLGRGECPGAFVRVRQVGVEQGQVELHRSEEHTSELQSLMRNSYAVFCLKKTTPNNKTKQ